MFYLLKDGCKQNRIAEASFFFKPGPQMPLRGCVESSLSEVEESVLPIVLVLVNSKMDFNVPLASDRFIHKALDVIPTAEQVMPEERR